MKAAGTSETLVSYQDSEDIDLKHCHRESLKTRINEKFGLKMLISKIHLYTSGWTS